MNEQTPELCDCEIKVTGLTTSFFAAQMYWQIVRCPKHAAADDLLTALEWALPLLMANAPAPFETEAARLTFAKQLIAAQHVVRKAKGGR